MRTILFILPAAFFLFSPLAAAEPRWVDLREALDSASVVAEVTILQYMDNRLWVQSARDPSVRAEVRYSTDPLWSPKRFVQDAWKNEKELTAVWPPVGSTVIVVLDEFGVISLFARTQSEGWRFWSPQMTGSTALFACAPPAKVIQPVGGKDDYHKNKSWDGCWLPSAAVKWKDLDEP